MPRTELPLIGKQMDMDVVRNNLNTVRKHVVNLTEGQPDDWKNLATFIKDTIGKMMFNDFVHCFVFHDVLYDTPKLVVMRVPKSSTTRPYSNREYGCIFHTSNEVQNGLFVSKKLELYHPFTIKDKQMLWERSRVIVNG